MGTGCGIHRYDQRQEEKGGALALGFDIVVQCIILRERLAIQE